jgi:hypothetical protein
MIKVELIVCCDEPGCEMTAKIHAPLGYRLILDEMEVPTGWRFRRGYNHPGPEWGNPSIFCVCSVHNNNYAQEETNEQAQRNKVV